MLINLRLLKQVKLIQRVGYLEAENTELKYDVNQLKSKLSKQDEENNSKISSNWSNYYENKKMNNDESFRTLDRPPTSCQELKDGSRLEVMMDGIYLLQNIQTNKIQATFCQFKDSNQSNKILKNQILFLKEVN